MSLCDLNFKNSFVESLPGKEFLPPEEPRPQMTPNVAYSRVSPQPVKNPQLVSWSDAAAELLGLQLGDWTEREAAQIFSGNRICPSMKPYAARYGGHQFGHWAGQLGDGRAITLAEVVNPKGESWEVQLKGAGLTPYSRGADGRAVLRSSLREYVCSEAMFYLGVPTTRALCLVTTGESVVRDMFYDGHPQAEPGAITTRLAPSFVRFGHFQMCAFLSELELLKQTVHYVMDQHFPQFRNPEGKYDYLKWYSHVVESTAQMVVHWLRVGFVHGVMNTDNMSIHGLTIDYGPFGWLDVYDPEWTPNTTDAGQRRYRFAAQPAVAMWNLAQLGEALGPLLGGEAAVHEVLNDYQHSFRQKLLEMMGQKLGFAKGLPPGGIELIEELDRVLRLTEVDTTLFYRKLSELHLQPVKEEDFGHPERWWGVLGEAYYAKSPPEPALEAMGRWLKKYWLQWGVQDESKEDLVGKMNQANPYFIPRNYILQQCIDELEKGETRQLNQVMRALQSPYEENDMTRPFFAKRPEWARQRAGCSDLSCSS